MKMDPDLHTISREASVLMAFAAELFVGDVAQVSWVETQLRQCTIMNVRNLLLKTYNLLNEMEN